MLILGIYKENLETLINKCKQIIEKDYNISHKQYFYDLISDLEEQYINLIEEVRVEKRNLADFFEGIKILKQRKEIKEKIDELISSDAIKNVFYNEALIWDNPDFTDTAIVVNFQKA